jgi:broad specificity phosphatase PhoE
VSAAVWLVRHGETAWSRDGRHTSVTEVELTDVGAHAAREVGPRLAGHAFALVLTSPRVRARRTADLAGFPDAIVDDDLAEWAYGEYEGITTVEIRQSVPDWTVWTHPSPGGETAAEVSARLDRVIERLRAAAGDALVFGHSHSLRALAARWVGLPVTDGRLLVLDTASISVLGFERATPVITRWNA